MKQTQSNIFKTKESRRDKHIRADRHAALRRQYREHLPVWRRPAWGYLAAILLTALATMSELYMQYVLGRILFPNSLTFLAVLLIALFWGVGPAVLAMVLGFIALDYYFILPARHFEFFTWDGLLQLVPFLVAGLATALITAQRESAMLDALAAEQELESYATELEDADLLKDRFLSIASHELKTPITTIRGQAQLLLRRLARQRRQDGSDMVDLGPALERINEQTGRLTSLVDELLDVSRIRKGKIQLHKSWFDLREVCRDVVEDQRALTGRQISLEMPSTPVEIEGDSDRLTQVVVNLLTNALKYSPEESSVEVALSQCEQHNILLKVRDYGYGIAKDQQERIFEAFYRAPEAEESVKHGLGLGLAISKDIVERHAGRIWCESEPDKGSVFFIELPHQFGT